jgi:hypothetical protein
MSYEFEPGLCWAEDSRAFLYMPHGHPSVVQDIVTTPEEA